MYSSILIGIVVLGIFGPEFAPYGETEINYSPEGEHLSLESPSLAHPLGTTQQGYDVLSRLLYGARATVLVGVLGGSAIIAIGAAVGITAGYFGGRTENLLMRMTDFWYGIPVIPFAIVLAATFGIDFFTSILIIAACLWRASARVLRSQVLQIKERPYILVAKASGASDRYVIIKHILPNVAPMIALFFAFGIASSILIQAGLAYLGVADPFITTWGAMIRNAQNSGFMAQAWWWSIPPGLLISMTVLSTIMLGQKSDPRDDGSMEDGMTGV